MRKDRAVISYTNRVIADFVENFVARATALVAVEFVWHRSIARSRKTVLGANISRIALTKAEL